MTKEHYLANLICPLPNALLKKYPAGNIMQFWADNPTLYSSVFGQHDDMYRFASGHTGIDIATSHRDNVVAAQEGTVYKIKTDRTSLGGLCVWIMSPNLDDGDKREMVVHVYGHLDQILVKENQYVKQGDILGYEGNSGFVISGGTPYWGDAPAGAGVHLHFGLSAYVIKNGAWVSPYPLLGGTFDPLPWLTDPDNLDTKIEGDWSGTLILLENLKKLLLFWKK